MRLVWTEPALADRRAIYEFIEPINPRAALALDERIGEQTRRLLMHPRVGRPGRVKGTRKLVVHPHYLLLYDLRDDLVRVLRVLHTSRQWPPEIA